MAIIALHNSHNSGMRWSMEHLAERALHSTHNLEFLMTLQKERAGGGGGGKEGQDLAQHGLLLLWPVQRTLMLGS